MVQPHILVILFGVCGPGFRHIFLYLTLFEIKYLNTVHYVLGTFLIVFILKLGVSPRRRVNNVWTVNKLMCEQWTSYSNSNSTKEIHQRNSAVPLGWRSWMCFIYWSIYLDVCQPSTFMSFKHNFAPWSCIIIRLRYKMTVKSKSKELQKQFVDEH